MFTTLLIAIGAPVWFLLLWAARIFGGIGYDLYKIDREVKEEIENKNKN